jgi:excinuclease UvrABC ATPase subunit
VAGTAVDETPQTSDLAEWVRGLDEPSAAPLLAKLRQTLDSFVEIGLGYLSLDRPSGTLSGGEAQRTKMIGHLGSSLTDVAYVFDEPTTGLHLADVEQLLGLLDRLIEHHQAVIARADWIIDLGPGAGHDGGRIVFAGTPAALVAARATLTGEHLAAYVGA